MTFPASSSRISCFPQARTSAIGRCQLAALCIGSDKLSPVMARSLGNTLTIICLGVLLFGFAAAEDGYELWLRYPQLNAESRALLARSATAIVAPREISPTTQAAIDELARGLGGLLGATPPVTSTVRSGAILIGTAQTLPAIATLALPLEDLGNDGFVIRSAVILEQAVTVVAANTEIGELYGVFALLRHVQTGNALSELDLLSTPRIGLRLLNHWDNLDRSVERGYAGQSLWDWMTLPQYRDSRYVDYARANASLGINGTVLNNVNANSASLTAPYVANAATLADLFRPYGLRVYLSVRFSAPIEIGGLASADPLDPEVASWWRAKAAEIYAAIPDFGGFLVKANSEGQPGPQDYGRSHADGANMLAAAVERHGGIVMWRAFVYRSDNPEDRAKQAYNEFVPLDGSFAENVIVQAKNGPIDFQPREPFHPLFGAMPQTPLMMEVQITKEYLGMASHLVYLGTLYQEALTADTYAAGTGSTVARVVDGTLHGHALSAIAGVANTGTDRDWSGSSFNQANWYAFGRLAWNPSLSAGVIAEEWLKQTFSTDPEFIAAASQIMLGSREAAVDYMTPLGLAHLMATGHHYGPGPWVSELARGEWNPVYYHQADSEGIGFDRTVTGSNAISQYTEPVARGFANPESIDNRYLLWFHHLPWDYPMRSGRNLWQELVLRYDRGLSAVETMQLAWSKLERFVDTERFDKTTELLKVQRQEAKWWRDACIAYFQNISNRPLPAELEPPEFSLDYYKAIDNSGPLR